MFHKEGYKVILITTISIGGAFILIDKFVTDSFLNKGISFAILLAYLFILQLYWNRKRAFSYEENAFLSPVDGVLKSIDKTPQKNSKGEEVLLSFYVSPFKFHSVLAPFKGSVIESSGEAMPNSKLKIQTIEIQHHEQNGLCTRIQIYPAKFSQTATLYVEKNSPILQGEEIGFINFDALVTITVPKSSKLDIKINDRVKTGAHLIAKI